jgi:hypothetical protein
MSMIPDSRQMLFITPQTQGESRFSGHKLLKCLGNGRHDWIRTSDLFRVKEAL